ncbi:hypothetical protein ACSNOI_30945 [Actinomadura kijaniata]|uniref:hypothetical protein n=1 Tax=Actinomadura kijaniata TaxID=46161 RepID=UPI003F1C11F5
MVPTFSNLHPVSVLVPPTPHATSVTSAGGVVSEGTPLTVTDLNSSVDAESFATTLKLLPAAVLSGDAVAVTVRIASADAPNAGIAPAASTAAVPSPTMIGFPADRGSTAPAPPSRHH